MILEVLRIITDGLQHATYGVNTMLPNVPRDGADPVPANIASFEEETSGQQAALGRLPETLPGICVLLRDLDIIDDQVAQDVGDGLAVVVIRVAYTAYDENDSTRKLEHAKRDVSYALRAIVGALRTLNKQENEDDRKLNSLVLLEAKSIIVAPYFETIEDNIVIGTVMAPYVLRDYWLA